MLLTPQNAAVLANERYPSQVPTAISSQGKMVPNTRVVIEDLPAGLWYHRPITASGAQTERRGGAGPVGGSLGGKDPTGRFIHEAKIGLVDEGRGLKRLARLLLCQIES
jgi:hypothetical protein